MIIYLLVSLSFEEYSVSAITLLEVGLHIGLSITICAFAMLTVVPSSVWGQDYNSPTIVEPLGTPFLERRFNPSERDFALRSAGQARTTLSSELKDYPSSRFQSVRAILPKGRKFPYFCGQINSKNSFGGYTGWKDFYVDGGLFEIMPEHDSDNPKISRIIRDEWRKRCSFGEGSVDTLDYSNEMKAQ